jgi:transposase
LQQSGTLNPHPERVADPLFAGSDFFDPDDLVQVKYEMLRRVEADQSTVRQAAEAFGYSRPVYYQARAACDAQGLGGLVPAKRGPKGGHKLTAEVVAYLEALRASEGLSAAAQARRVAEHFGIQVHPRSIERARARGKKTSPDR